MNSNLPYRKSRAACIADRCSNLASSSVFAVFYLLALPIVAVMLHFALAKRS